MTHADVNRFSFTRAVETMVKNRRLDGVEAECVEELRRAGYRAPEDSTGHLSFPLPWDAPLAGRQTRAGVVTTTIGAGSITTKLGSAIDTLRNRMVLPALGATVIPDCRGGKFALPQKTSVSSTTWVAENAAPAEGALTATATCSFTPKTNGSYSDYTRLALAEIPGVETLILADLLASIAHECDRAAINGAGGAGGVPDLLGICQDPRIPVYTLAGDSGNGSAVSRADVVAMEEMLGVANGDSEPDALVSWLTSPQGRSALRKVDNAGTSGSGRYVWSDRDTILGKNAFSTASVPATVPKGSASNTTVLTVGNWRDAVLALWGPPTIIVNPYVFSSTGIYRITALLDADFNLRRPKSFVNALGFIAP